MKCGVCGRKFRGIAAIGRHYRSAHPAKMHRKRGKGSRAGFHGSGRVRVPPALLKRLAAACNAFYGK